MTELADEPSQAWIDVLSRVWSEDQSQLLELMIKAGRYVASSPPRLRVQTGFLCGRFDFLLEWILEMTKNYDADQIATLSPDELEAALDVLHHHQRWDDMVAVVRNMWAIVSPEYWSNFVLKISEANPTVVWRFAQVGAPILALTCLRTLREIEWKPVNSAEILFFQARIVAIPDSGEARQLHRIDAGLLATAGVVWASDRSRKSRADGVRNWSGWDDDGLGVPRVTVHAPAGSNSEKEPWLKNITFQCGPLEFNEIFPVSTGAAGEVYDIEIYVHRGMVRAKWQVLRYPNWYYPDETSTFLVHFLGSISPHRVSQVQLEALELTVPMITRENTDGFPEFVRNSILWSQHLKHHPMSLAESPSSGRFTVVNSSDLETAQKMGS